MARTRSSSVSSSSSRSSISSKKSSIRKASKKKLGRPKKINEFHANTLNNFANCRILILFEQVLRENDLFEGEISSNIRYIN